MTKGDIEAISSHRVGRVLAGRWHLQHLLGAGSAGAVYLAAGTNGETAAVKMLHPELAAEPTVRARFVREAYVANKIDHPGVVRVLEDGVDEDDTPFIVMELLDGETLEARLERKGGRLSVNEVLWAADRTLQVLNAAHAKGVVHRDIKPENLFLTVDRRLKVLDFGIARLGEAREETKMGTILGTLAFMPPEQARGDMGEVGVRSDLWSVGATMFTLLSGRLVRDDEDVLKLLREAGKTKVSSLRDVAPELPRDLSDLVDYALSLEAQARWPTAKTMRRAVKMVHAKLRRESLRAPRDEDDEEVSEPSFGLIAMREIEPPPLSVGRPSEERIAIAKPAAPSSSDIAQLAAGRKSSETTMRSETEERPTPSPPEKPAPKKEDRAAAEGDDPDDRGEETADRASETARLPAVAAPKTSASPARRAPPRNALSPWVLPGALVLLAVAALILAWKI